MSTLADRLLAIHGRLEHAGIPHGFGGAIALAYCTGEPRGTIDIDINVFVGPAEAKRVFTALPREVASGAKDLQATKRAGQVRLFWDDTPIDLFFSYHPLHQATSTRVAMVPFECTEIPVLACEDLLVYKAFYARTKDWADIEAMIASSSLDIEAACRQVADLLGADHASYRRLLDVLAAMTLAGQPRRLP
ncbi:MAG: hypothetical protein ACYCS7_02170 [Acidimicrobiales bacterium]